MSGVVRPTVGEGEALATSQVGLGSDAVPITRPAVGPVAGMVTLVFTDIEGSTRLVARLRDGYWELLAAHRRLVREAFERADGREIDTQGDSFFFAFNRATDAVSAAIAAQRALSAHRWPAGVQVRVRMGIHSTKPTLWSGGYVGLGVHRAARICSAGHGGQILMSDATRTLIQHELPESCRLHDLGRYQLKDLDRPDRIWQVSAAGLRDRFPQLRAADEAPGGRVAEPPDAAGSREGPASGLAWLEQAAVPSFVGRTAELRALEDAWSQAASGRRILVLLGGEPGIGKTTLAARLAVGVHTSGGLVLHGRWDADARVSYQAFVECLEEYSRSRAKTVLDAGLDRHARQISHIFQAGDRTGVADTERSDSAEAERSRLFEAIDGLLRAMTSRRPVLVVLDDLQWADSSSLLLLRRLMRAPRATPLLVVATYRNTELGRGRASSFLPALTQCPDCRQMVVGGLSVEESDELVARVTGVKLAAPAPQLTRQLHQETAGNPSRLIEMVQRRHDADTLPAARRPRSPTGNPAFPPA